MTDEVVEASDIGLKPGNWPPSIQYDGAEFKRVDVVFDKEGDVSHAKYQGVHVMRQLVVLND